MRQYFRQLNFDENLAAGQAAVEGDLKRLDLEHTDLAPVAEQFKFRRVDDLLAAVGAGDLTAAQVAQAALRIHGDRETDKPDLPFRRVPQHEADTPGGEVRIEGVGNLMHQLARCCQPVPGDPIAGFITRTRGVSIHRDDCRQYLRLAERHPERRIRVEWSRSEKGRYPARILIEAWDRRDLIRDIGSVLSNQGLSVRSMNAERGEQPEAVRIELALEVGDVDQLTALLGKLQTITNVSLVRRLS